MIERLTVPFVLACLAAQAQPTWADASGAPPSSLAAPPFQFNGVSNWTDTSSVPGKAATFWTRYFGGATTQATASRFNRILCGPSTATSTDFYPTGKPTPVTTSASWVETLFPSWDTQAQLSCSSTVGAAAANFATRSSDYRAAVGLASRGSDAVNAIGVNDDTIGNPIAAGLVGLALRNSGVGGQTLGAQMDVVNKGSEVRIYPSAGMWPAGSTFGALITSGFNKFGARTINKPSVGLAFADGGFNTPFLTGILFKDGAVDASYGASGGGVALELYQKQAIQWLGPHNDVRASIWGSDAGLLHIDGPAHMASSLSVATNIAAGGSVNASGNVVAAGALSGSSLVVPSFTPASSSAPCSVGQHSWDESYIYICTSTNTWKRAALTSF